MKRLLALPFAALLLLGANAASADPATEIDHVVEEGETLNGIANRAGVPAAVIAAANGLTEPYVVKLGQRLHIPRQRNHTVKDGETGFGIAIKYGVPFSAIRTANGLDKDGNIRIGQTLIIPAVIPQASRPSVRPTTRTSTASPTPTPKATSKARDDGTPYFRAPHDGSVMLGYQRRADGGGHEGLDYAVDVGDMVRASASGTVIYAGDEPVRFGKLVIIGHGNKWYTAYGHLSRVTVTKGEQVKQGERIGLAGQTGVATEPELHFEIRRNKAPVDPATLIRD